MTVYVTRKLKASPKTTVETVMSRFGTIKDNKSIVVMITATLEKCSIARSHHIGSALDTSINFLIFFCYEKGMRNL